MKIAAIPTEYNGTRYRSRTEARWAVFFDRARIRVRYETEGFQTDAGWYLPDFEFQDASRKTCFEVKPSQPTTDELALLSALARGAEAHVFVALGPPEPGALIWKVFANGDHKQWYFARDQQWLVSFLVDIEADYALPIRQDVSVDAVRSIGASSELTAAQQHQFPLFGGGKPVHGVRDRRDWRQREREVLNTRTAEIRERRPR